GCSPLAAARTSASVACGSPSSNDWAGLRAATVTPAARSAPRVAAPTQVLPTSVAVPTTRTRRSGRATGRLQRIDTEIVQRTEQVGDLVVGVGGTEGDAQPAGTGRHGGRADGRHEQAGGQERRGCGDGTVLVAEHHRHDRR